MLSFRDPENRAYLHRGNWYRIALGDSAVDLDQFLRTPLLSKLVQRRSIPSVARVDSVIGEEILCDPNIQDFVGSNTALVIAVETVEPITFPWEWSTQKLRLAALFTLELRKELLLCGFDLKDASACNISFVDGHPVLVDVGSIVKWDGRPHWGASAQFVQHFLNPLLVSRKVAFHVSDLWRMKMMSGISTDEARSAMTFRDKISMRTYILQRLAVPSKSISDTRENFQANFNDRLAQTISIRQTENLRRAIISTSFGRRGERSTWGTYGKRSHYATSELDNKITFAVEFARKNGMKNRYLMDLGGNDGLIARHICSETDRKVVTVDDDPETIEKDHDLLELSARSITVRADLLSVTEQPALGISKQESLMERFKPTGILCHAVLHHLVITQAIPLELIVNFLKNLGVPIQVEFVAEDDPMVKLLTSRIVSWKGKYSLSHFLDLSKNSFKVVDVLGPTSKSRVMIEMNP